MVVVVLAWESISLRNEAFDDSKDYLPLVLAFRRAPSLGSPSSQASPAGRAGESPDVTVIEELIVQEPGSDVDKESMVLLAWCEFCLNYKHDSKTDFPDHGIRRELQALNQTGCNCSYQRVEKGKGIGPGLL